MFTNGYIDEIAIWDYDEDIEDYAKQHTERAMSFKDFFDFIERLAGQCDVLKWQIDSMNPDYITACVHAITTVCPARALLNDALLVIERKHHGIK